MISLSYRIFRSFVFLYLIMVAQAGYATVIKKDSSAKIANLEYVENRGQWPDQVKFKTTLHSGSMFLEKNAFTFCLVNPEDTKHNHGHLDLNDTIPVAKHPIRMHAYRISFEGANKQVTLSGKEQTKDVNNYFIGNDPAKWASKVSKYKIVEYQNIYKNIDLNIYSNWDSPKYDFIVNPGGRVGDILLRYDGITKMYLQNKQLVLETNAGRVVELAPYAYQLIEGRKVEIACDYKLDDETIRFDVKEKYNKKYPLIIDPHLVFCTYTGSTSDNWGFTATFDNDSNVYSGGIVQGNIGYPTTLGGFNGGESNANGPGWDIGIIKYTPDGANRLWATYLGGNSTELPHSLIVNQFNELVILGTTGSSDFPVSANAYDKTFHGGDAITYDNVLDFSKGIDIFVTKLSQNGLLLASTYVGGSGDDGLNFRNYNGPDDITIEIGNDSLYYNYADGARGQIITDKQNNVYVGISTFSTDFPVTANAFQPTSSGNQEGVVFKLDYNLSNLIWSSYLGGSSKDAIYSVDVDSKYDIYVAGGTSSPNFPTTAGAFNTTYNGGSADAFVAHISSNGNKLVESTLFGSDQYDQAYFVRIGKDNNAYIYGQTKAKGSILIKNAIYNKPNSGQFLAKFKTNSLKELEWSTVFGTGNGKPNISPSAFSVDICNRIYLAGWGREWENIYGQNTWSYGTETTTYNGNVYTRLNTGWNYIEGTKGMYVTPNASQKITDGQDFYILVLDDNATAPYYATFFGELNIDTIYYNPNVPSGPNFLQTDFGGFGKGRDHVDGGTSRFDKLGNIYQSVCASCGGYNSFPVTAGAYSVYNNSTNCNNAVFKFKIDIHFVLADFVVPPIACVPVTANFINKSVGPNYRWNFGDGSPESTAINPSHLYTKSGVYKVQLIVYDSLSCNLSDTIVKEVQFLSNSVYALPNQSTCPGNGVKIGIDPINDPNVSYHWHPAKGLNDATISNPVATPDSTTNYLLTVSNGICTDSISVLVLVKRLQLNKLNDTTICFGNAIKPKITIQAGSTDVISSYVWSTNKKFTDTLSKTALLNIIPALSGYYYVKVGTPTGCEYIDSINVTLDNINPFLIKSDLRCNKDSSGFISVVPNSIFFPITYIWSNGVTDSMASKLLIGTYQVTITDKIGCGKILSATLSEPTKLTSSETHTDNSCNGNCSATASLTINGGSPGYSIIWSDGNVGTGVSGLCAGKYLYQIIDKNNCLVKGEVNISSPSDMKYDYKFTEPICWDSCNGTAVVNITGGVKPYQYSWNSKTNFVVNDSIRNKLCMTSFDVYLLDANNCKNYINITITGPDTLKVGHTLLQKISCFGNCNAVVSTIATGGVPYLTYPFYKYQWSNFANTPGISGLCAAKYVVTVTDKNNCSIRDSIIITQPATINLQTKKTDMPCANVCKGTILVKPINGTPPYSYNWGTSNYKGDSLTNLCNGIYNLKVVDSLKCEIDTTILINNTNYVPELTAWADKYTIYLGESVNIYATDKTPGLYSYVWSPDNTLSDPTSSHPVATAIEDIIYTVEITDTKGCKNKANLKLKVVSGYCTEPYIYVPNAFSPNGDGLNDVLYVKANGINSLYFAIYNRWGEKVFETNTITKGWDGKYKGVDADPAVFDYYVRIICSSGETFAKKGNITLIR